MKTEQLQTEQKRIHFDGVMQNSARFLVYLFSLSLYLF